MSWIVLLSREIGSSAVVLNWWKVMLSGLRKICAPLSSFPVRLTWILVLCDRACVSNLVPSSYVTSDLSFLVWSDQLLCSTRRNRLQQVVVLAGPGSRALPWLDSGWANNADESRIPMETGHVLPDNAYIQITNWLENVIRRQKSCAECCVRVWKKSFRPFSRSSFGPCIIKRRSDLKTTSWGKTRRLLRA